MTSLHSSLLTFLLRHFTVAEGVTNVRIKGLILVNGLANDGNNVADASGGCLLMQQDAGLHILNVEFRNCSATGIFVRSVGVCAPRLLVWGVTHTQWVQLHRCRCTSVCMLHACMHAWRWEQPLFKYDPCWRKTAQDKQAWLNALNDMVLWRSTHR